MSQLIKLSDGKEVTISLLPLRAYGDLLKTLQSVFKEIVSEWDNASNDEIIDKIPEFLGDHLEDAASIIAIGTRGQVTKDELLDERGLADAIQLLTAILLENDVEGMANSIKKATAAFRGRKAQATAPAATPNPTPAQ